MLLFFSGKSALFLRAYLTMERPRFLRFASGARSIVLYGAAWKEESGCGGVHFIWPSAVR